MDNSHDDVIILDDEGEIVIDDEIEKKKNRTIQPACIIDGRNDLNISILDEENSSYKVQHVCLHCGYMRRCKFALKFQETFYFFCSTTCVDKSKKIISGVNYYQNPKVPIGKVNFKCDKCNKDLQNKLPDVDTRIQWRMRYYCSHGCLKYSFFANGLTCGQCHQKLKGVTPIGDSIWRYGRVTHFCTEVCKRLFLKKINICQICSNEMKEDKIFYYKKNNSFLAICSQECITKKQLIDKQIAIPIKKITKCHVCKKTKFALYEFKTPQQNELSFCSEVCLNVHVFYLKQNLENIVIGNCFFCKAYFNSNQDNLFVIYPNNFMGPDIIIFCSDLCWNIFICQNKTDILKCFCCNVRLESRYLMFQKMYNGNILRTCSIKCTSIYNFVTCINHGQSLFCNSCKKKKSPSYFYLLEDGTLKAFCSIECANKSFQNSSGNGEFLRPGTHVRKLNYINNILSCESLLKAVDLSIQLKDSSFQRQASYNIISGNILPAKPNVPLLNKEQANTKNIVIHRNFGSLVSQTSNTGITQSNVSNVAIAPSIISSPQFVVMAPQNIKLAYPNVQPKSLMATQNKTVGSPSTSKGVKSTRKVNNKQNSTTYIIKRKSNKYPKLMKLMHKFAEKIRLPSIVNKRTELRKIIPEKVVEPDVIPSSLSLPVIDDIDPSTDDNIPESSQPVTPTSNTINEDFTNAILQLNSNFILKEIFMKCWPLFHNKAVNLNLTYANASTQTKRKKRYKEMNTQTTPELKNISTQTDPEIYENQSEEICQEIVLDENGVLLQDNTKCAVEMENLNTIKKTEDKKSEKRKRSVDGIIVQKEFNDETDDGFENCNSENITLTSILDNNLFSASSSTNSSNDQQVAKRLKLSTELKDRQLNTMLREMLKKDKTCNVTEKISSYTALDSINKTNNVTEKEDTEVENIETFTLNTDEENEHHRDLDSSSELIIDEQIDKKSINEENDHELVVDEQINEKVFSNVDDETIKNQDTTAGDSNLTNKDVTDIDNLSDYEKKKTIYKNKIIPLSEDVNSKIKKILLIYNKTKNCSNKSFIPANNNEGSVKTNDKKISNAVSIAKIFDKDAASDKMKKQTDNSVTSITKYNSDVAKVTSDEEMIINIDHKYAKNKNSTISVTDQNKNVDKIENEENISGVSNTILKSHYFEDKNNDVNTGNKNVNKNEISSKDVDESSQLQLNMRDKKNRDKNESNSSDVTQNKMMINMAESGIQKLERFCRKDINTMSDIALYKNILMFLKASKTYYTCDKMFYDLLEIQIWINEKNRKLSLFMDEFCNELQSVFNIHLVTNLLTSEQPERKRLQQNSSPNQNERESCVNEDCLWKSGILGTHSPDALLSSVIYFNCKLMHKFIPKDHQRVNYDRLKSCQETCEQNIPSSTKQNCGDYLSLTCNSKKCPNAIYSLYKEKYPWPLRYGSVYLQPIKNPEDSWFSKNQLSLSDLKMILNRFRLVKEICDAFKEYEENMKK